MHWQFAGCRYVDLMTDLWPFGHEMILQVTLAIMHTKSELTVLFHSWVMSCHATHRCLFPVLWPLDFKTDLYVCMTWVNFLWILRFKKYYSLVICMHCQRVRWVTKHNKTSQREGCVMRLCNTSCHISCMIMLYWKWKVVLMKSLSDG